MNELTWPLASFKCFLEIVKNRDFRSGYFLLIFSKFICWCLLYIPTIFILAFLAGFFGDQFMDAYSGIVAFFIIDSIFNYPFICYKYFSEIAEMDSICRKEKYVLEHYKYDYLDLQLFIENYAPSSEMADEYINKLSDVSRECFCGLYYKEYYKL